MDRKVIEMVGKISITAGQEILKYTPQLYHRLSLTEPIKIEPWASGVFLKIDGNHFLVSAGHVLMEGSNAINPENVGIMIGKQYHILNGNVKYTDTSLHEANSKIDLTIWKLEDERVIQDLSQKYLFLEPTSIDIDHKPSNSPNYLIVGFPITRTKIKAQTQSIKVDPFIFLTNQKNDKLYSKLQFERHSNLILDYRKRKIRSHNGSLVQGPDPHGLSGCGLWHIPELMINSSGGVFSKLVGIMTEWHSNHNAVVATRIHIVTEVIRREFGLTIPKSKITEINLH